jgi:hypothetical protein
MLDAHTHTHTHTRTHAHIHHIRHTYAALACFCDVGSEEDALDLAHLGLPENLAQAVDIAALRLCILGRPCPLAVLESLQLLSTQNKQAGVSKSMNKWSSLRQERTWRRATHFSLSSGLCTWLQYSRNRALCTLAFSGSNRLLEETKPLVS